MLMEGENSDRSYGDNGVDRWKLSAVYTSLLELLPLSDSHRANLRSRGFTDEQINIGMYRSFPSDFSAKIKIVETLVEKFGAEVCKQVPGFYVSKETGVMMLAGAGGLMFPLRNGKHISALKIRSDSFDKKNKYTYLSSKTYGGRKSKADIHTPAFAPKVEGVVRFTEGELKADIATIKTGILTKSIPGVSNRKMAFGEVGNLTHTIKIALDSDAKKNRDVARAVLDLVLEFTRNGKAVEIETWDEKFKGIDDALVAGAEIIAVTNGEALEYANRILNMASHPDISTNDGAAAESEQGGNCIPKEFSKIEEGCVSVSYLLDKSRKGNHLSHRERFLLANLAVGAGLNDQDIAPLFQNQTNFDASITQNQIASIRAGRNTVNCATMSSDLKKCDGNCTAKQLCLGRSPIDLMKSRLPEIETADRQFRDIVEDARRAIHLYNSPEPKIFVRLNHLVAVDECELDTKIIPLNKDMAYGMLVRAADWVGTNERTKKKTPKKPHKDIAGDLIASVDKTLPHLESVIFTPVLSSQGKLIHKPGYYPDEATIYDRRGITGIIEINSPISDAKVKEHAQWLSRELFQDFPFASNADRAHAFAGLFLPFVRKIINGPTPPLLIEASTQGTGKGLLVNIVGLASTGEIPNVQTLASSEDEIKKMVTSKLSDSPRIILFDNLPQYRLNSPTLAAVFTSEIWSDRILGVSRMASVPNKALWIITGNNPNLSPELVRRVIRCRLDAKMDRPASRDPSMYRHPSIADWVKQNRVEIMNVILQIVQAWVLAGMPKYKGPGVKGSFESWVEIIGGILQFAGIDGFLENEADLHAEVDSESESWRTFVQAWWDRFKSESKGARELNDLCHQLNLLPEVRRQDTSRGQETALGTALMRKKDGVFGNFQIKLARNNPNGRKYLLEPIKKPSSPEKREPGKDGSITGPQEDFVEESSSYSESGDLKNLRTDFSSKNSISEEIMRRAEEEIW